MREIKFRAWDNEINKMFYPDSNLCIKFNGEKFALHNTEYTSIEQNNLELMQYTGLKDKNGVEIYEGDILEYGADKGVVKFNVKESEYRASKRGQGTPLSAFHFHNGASIIGNIYENKELLK